jgi:hypothetical protein
MAPRRFHYSIPKTSAIDQALVAKDLPKFKHLIAQFHHRVQRGEPKLSLLQEFAAVVVYREQSYMQMRPMSVGMRKGVGPCFVCQEPGYARHHIIAVKNGGLNRGSNLVRLCPRCHRDVHPWLKA